MCVWMALLLATGIALAAPSQDAPDPRTGWDFAFSDFVIAAWSPPAATDAEYAVYREAGFNLVMHPRYSLPDEALRLAEKHGLKLLIDTYTPNDKPWGGEAGEYVPHPAHHPATLPELRWLHERYGDHPALAGYLLGDDYGVLPQELIDTTRFLRENAPHLFPWICQNVMSAESLAKAGNPVQDPQIYPTLYQKDWPADQQAVLFCRMLERLRAGCLEHGLTPWPMFNVSGVDSDSLLRFQIHASLAYGAQGIWYFTYRDHGGIQTGGGYQTEDEVRANLRPLWQEAAEQNNRVAHWGPELLGRTCEGVFHTGWRVTPGVRPGEGVLIEKMADGLLAGVLTKTGEPPLVMLVDKRVGTEPGAIPKREVTVSLAPAVTGVDVIEPDGTRTVSGSELKLTLRAGDGKLLRLHGEGLDELCSGLQNAPEEPALGKPGKDGMVLHLRFDEGEGDVAHDASGLGNDATLSGVKWTEGKSGKAISLEAPGSTGVVWDTSLCAREEMTLAAWIKPRYPATGYGPILHVGTGGVDRFEFGVGPDNLYPVITDKVSHSGGQLYVSDMKTEIPEGEWGHIAVSAGPDGAVTYINGKPVRGTEYAGRFDFDIGNVQIGFRGNEHYSGAVDDIRIYARRLSPEEVAKLAANSE